MLFRNISFMKINRSRRYDYTPRYYDEKKEKLKARIRRYESENQNENENENENRDIRLIELRERISDNWVRGEEYKKSIFTSNIRLVIILAVILALIFFVFNGLDIGGAYLDKLQSK